jgi:tRNA-dihydrouridine synthase
MEKPNLKPIKAGAIFMAPMEGVTDMPFRNVIENLYPRWDYLACDFLRVPSNGKYPRKYLIKHYGEKAYRDEYLKAKTLYQILTSQHAMTKEIVEDIALMGIPWLDLNLGCPSKTVVKRCGGSYLLKEPEILKQILLTIRESFPGRFSVKIRIGFDDDKLFEHNLKLIEDCGVEAVTIHARTRAQLYKGRADWNYIKKATKLLTIPVIANGDIWNKQDIIEVLDQTNCHAVMLGRSAMKAPWLAQEFYQPTDTDTISHIKSFFYHYHLELAENNFRPEEILKRSKQLTRYMFDDLDEGSLIKTKLLRTTRLADYQIIIKDL